MKPHKPPAGIRVDDLAHTILHRFMRFREGGVFLALVLMVLSFSLWVPHFGTVENLVTVLRQFSFVAIIAAGQTFVLLTGGIDLSVGAIGGLSGILSAWLMVNTTLDPFLCAFLGVLVGLVAGLFNGWLITQIGLNPFVVTLGTMNVFSGLTMVITKGWAIVRLPESIFVLGRGQVLGIPMPVLIMALVFIGLELVLRLTPLGRHIYAVGGNEEAAYLVGIRTKLIQLFVYGLSGTMAAVAGVVMVARLTSGQPTVGAEWLLPSIAAAVIGGAALSGGEGTLLGTFIGAAIMGVLSNGIVLMGVSPYWQTVVVGSVVVLAVGVDVARRRLGHE